MPTRPPSAQYFKQIRTWEGRQTRAFEELCFQLRDREPDGVELRKTSDPDGGLEWYWVYSDASEVGWQRKFSDNERSLMSMMDASFESVRKRRPKARDQQGDEGDDHPLPPRAFAAPAARRRRWLAIRTRHFLPPCWLVSGAAVRAPAAVVAQQRRWRNAPA